LRRHFRTILVLLILAATAVAFVVTEDLKLEPDPIARPRIDRTFSPICQCDQQSAQIAFRLREEDDLTLSVADGSGRAVRTLLRNAHFRPAELRFGWDGRDDRGQLGPEGEYRARGEVGLQLKATKQKRYGSHGRRSNWRTHRCSRKSNAR